MAYKTFWGAPGELVTLRSSAVVCAADNSTLTDANILPTLAVDCYGMESVFVGVSITGGTGPTMTFEPLFRDANAADGSRWRRLTLGALPGVTLGSAGTITTGAMASDLSMVELRVFGALVYFRCTAVANETNTTAWRLLGVPGRYMRGATPQRG